MPTTAVDSPSSMNILGGRNRPGSQPGAKRPVPAANSKKACKGERRHAPTHGVENRRRFLRSKTSAGFRLRVSSA